MAVNDLVGFAEPAKKVVEEISKGIGGLYRPLGTILNAKADSYKIKTLADANNYKVKVLESAMTLDQSEIIITDDNFEAKSKVDSVQGLALERMINIEVKKQLNLDCIVKKAIEFIEENETVKKEPVDSDWMSKFINEAQEISNEEMQNLWAKILSDEVANPNSYSLRALAVLKNMNKSDAELFTKFIKLSFNNYDGRYILSDRSLYEKHGLTFSDITLLEEIGVLSRNIVRYIDPGDNKILAENGWLINIHNKTQNRRSLGIYDTTNTGLELSRLIEKTHNDEYVNDFIQSVKVILGSDVDITLKKQ